MDSLNWTLKDALDYFSQDEEIAAVLTPNEWSDTINYDAEFLKVLRSALEYQGFDPKIIMRQLIKNRAVYLATHKTETKWDLDNISGDFVWSRTSKAVHTMSDHGPLSKASEFLIMLFLYRNNHCEKIIKKSVTGMTAILEMLKEKYKINDETRKCGTSLGAKDITLPRIAGVLPAVAVRMFHGKLVEEIVHYSSIPGAQVTAATVAGVVSPAVDVASHAICCPFLPSLHPRQLKDKKHLHAMMLFVAIKLDDVVHKKEKNYTGLQELFSYYRAGYNSAAAPEKSRVEVFTKLGFLSEDDTQLTQTMIGINSGCYEILKTMRTDDPWHTELMMIDD